MAEVNALKDKLADGEGEVKRLDGELQTALAVIPNLPRDDVPVGPDETANKEVRRVGTPATFFAGAQGGTPPSHAPKQHFELGEALGLMDFETAAKVSGARFVFLKGDLARLERAIANLMLDIHTGEFGYMEVNPPLLVRDHAAFGTGNLPKFEADLFSAHRDLASIISEKIEAYSAAQFTTENRAKLTSLAIAAAKLERFWLIPTAEVSLTNMVRETILSEEELPMRLTAWTPCFRSEAGSAGRDVRGMIRQHQFSKVELVSITTPDKSLDEHERMTSCAEEVLKRLDLPFRTMLLSTGDMGFASQKTYDIEVWLPGQNAYREISSCSVCGDFQARRMDARYRPNGGSSGKAGGTEFVHTLNGSGLAVGRTLIAVMENYQQPDGSIAIPHALQPFMRGAKRVEAVAKRK